MEVEGGSIVSSEWRYQSPVIAPAGIVNGRGLLLRHDDRTAGAVPTPSRGFILPSEMQSKARN